MFTIEQATLIVNVLKIAAVLIPIAVLIYKVWRGKAKLKELKAACEAAVNTNREMAPLATDEKLRLAIETKVAVLQIVVDLIDGEVLTDNLTWELDETVKTLVKREAP